MTLDVKRLRELLASVDAPVRRCPAMGTLRGKDGRLVGTRPLIDAVNALGPLLDVYEKACIARDRRAAVSEVERSHREAERLPDYWDETWPQPLVDAEAAWAAAVDAVDLAVDKARGAP